MSEIYGPINGTITADYRFNLAQDYCIPGEPVNPASYITIFQAAGFQVFNRYVSGIACHPYLYVRLVTAKRPSSGYNLVAIRPFNPESAKQDFTIYHQLMNAIFPRQSIYCPVITLEERAYNMAGPNQMFDAKYCFFLDDGPKPVGFIVAFRYQNQLILKTIGLLPEYRGKKLSDLLVRRVHEQAKRDGLKAAVYSTIRVGNAVHKMKRPGVKIYRQYVTMRKTLD